jgi:hypothetical protein
VRRAALLCGAVVLAGCGGDSPSSHPTTMTTTRATPAPHRAERSARLPRGWKRVVDRRDGFSFGVPPGWKVQRAAAGELVRSADGALAVSVAYDRGPQGRTANLRAYAQRAARSLQGYRNLHVGPAHRVPGERHPTAAVGARGVFLKTHVRQAIFVVAVGRPRRGTFAVLSFRSARTRANRYAPELAALVRSLRTL